MHTHPRLLLTQLALAASACLATPTPPASSAPPLQCHDLKIDVAARALNRVLSFNLNSLTTPEQIRGLLASVESAGTTSVDGEYQIAAKFCSPIQSIHDRSQTLQILVHGVTYTNDYWFGPSTHAVGSASTNQSWVYQAAQQGYHVLAVDRLCNGQSSHPDGTLECQLPLEAAILDKVIQSARDGALPGVATKFEKIIYVGHSYGSMIGNWIAQSNPTAIDQLHLTGFSENLLIGSPSIVLRPAWLPAALLAPARFFGLDPGYLIATNRGGSESVYYSDNVDQAVLDHEWETRGVITAGELLTALLGQGKAPDYKGDVFVVNGDQDVLFCASDPVTAAEGNPGACESRQTSQHVSHYYPSARRFEYLNLADTGHSLGLHEHAFNAIAASHEFMTDS
ncbi:hypothetical protein V2A60_000244 [Cordyceps javanica]